ncbi:MAG: SH3 domain-containing protein [Clostridia bacterium]|nr:SH3 domain-containing protein [Clostridia bacterium]
MRKNSRRILAALVLLLLLPALALAADYAVVKGGRLNLREYASMSSRSLGKYNTGSWVILQQNAGNGWWQVRTLDGKSGYMSANYLNLGANAGSATVKYANGGYVNLRSGPSLSYGVVVRATSGSAVTILNDSYEWNYVSVVQNGYTYTGYMHDSLIERGVSTATVTTRNGGRVNVRSGPGSGYSSIGTLASGTQVTILLKGNGWYRISANGMTGFMSTQYISGSGSTVGSNTGSSSGTQTAVRIAFVNNPISTQVLNLRETPSQSARSIGQYRNGTQVKVVGYGATWCEVYVGTKHGYMMTRYLSFDGNYLPPSGYYPAATPTPLVQYITPKPYYPVTTPTPLVQYITPKPQYPGVENTPKAGTQITLAVAYGSSSQNIHIFNDSALASLKTIVQPGKQATMLQYGTSVCMILIDGGVAYVSTLNVNY